MYLENKTNSQQIMRAIMETAQLGSRDFSYGLNITCIDQSIDNAKIRWKSKKK